MTRACWSSAIRFNIAVCPGENSSRLPASRPAWSRWRGLNTIRRQRENPEYLKAVELLSEGKTGEVFDLLDKLGFIIEIPKAEERYGQMARDYADGLAAGTSEMIVSPTHAEGRAVVAAVREELRKRELLGEKDHELVRYESKDMSIARRKDAALYEAGDVVQWSKAAPASSPGSG